jgi:3-oxoacyl-(acyl-carrier-protein) synthase
MPRRVVVTGLGAVAPNGIGIDAFSSALHAGASGIGAISSFDPERLACRVAAEVKDFRTDDYLDGRSVEPGTRLRQAHGP